MVHIEPPMVTILIFSLQKYLSLHAGLHVALQHCNVQASCGSWDVRWAPLRAASARGVRSFVKWLL